MIEVKENPGLLKNPDNHAILNSNLKSLEEHKSKKLYFQSMMDRIVNLEKEVALLKARIDK